MVFSITLFVVSWICFFIFADTKKFHLYWTTCLLAMFLACTVDSFAHDFSLWEYPKPKKMHYLHHTMQQFGVYPIVVYLYIQTLPQKQNTLSVIRHIFYWSSLAVVIEWLATRTGYMEYQKWWNLGWSYLCDWILYLIFYFHHKWREKHV